MNTHQIKNLTDEQLEKEIEARKSISQKIVEEELEALELSNEKMRRLKKSLTQ